MFDNVHVHWGSVDRKVPLAWWLAYEGHGRFTKVDDFLKIVWPDVVHSINSHGIDMPGLDDHIGCFDIDPDLAANGVYDKLFFRHTNGAREFLRYSMGMISAYHSYAEESWSGSPYCEGFPQFLGKLFSGRSAENRLGDTCFLRVHVRSEDPRFDGERVKTCHPGHETGDPCGARVGPSINSGPFDSWTPVWEEVYTGQYYPMLSVEQDGEVLAFPALYEGGDLGAEGDWRGFSIFMHANRLAFSGYQLDLALYQARLLHDYGTAVGDAGYVDDARLLARWALIDVVDKGRLLIHEAGHVWTGGGHCVWNFCFEMAAQAWKCKVGALLGLQGRKEFPYPAPPAALELMTVATDDGDDGAKCRFTQACLVSAPGAVGSGAGFAASRPSWGP